MDPVVNVLKPCGWENLGTLVSHFLLISKYQKIQAQECNTLGPTEIRPIVIRKI